MNTPLVAVCGPTGSGKSGLAVALAQIFSGEAINCDSLQVYRRFNIGTAKLPESERGGVPHHLIDVAEADKGFTAGDFTIAARRVLAEIAARGNVAFVVGGTGFYLRSLLDGLSPSPPSSEALRSKLRDREQRRPGCLHRLLSRLDPVSGGRIHSRDLAKTVRALEIRILGNRKASEQPVRHRLEGYQTLKLGLFPPRELLYPALNLRCEAMLRDGLLTEIEQLLAEGVSREAKPFQSLGYKEGLAILENRLTFAEGLEQMQRDTRRYAKRQVTWFRHEPGMIPLYGFGNDAAIQFQAQAQVRALLDSK